MLGDFPAIVVYEAAIIPVDVPKFRIAARVSVASSAFKRQSADAAVCFGAGFRG